MSDSASPLSQPVRLVSFLLGIALTWVGLSLRESSGVGISFDGPAFMSLTTGVLLLTVPLQPNSSRFNSFLMVAAFCLCMPVSFSAAVMLIISFFIGIFTVVFLPFEFLGEASEPEILQQTVLQALDNWKMLALQMAVLSLQWMIFLHTRWIPMHPRAQTPEARKYLHLLYLTWCGGGLGLHWFYQKRWLKGLGYLLSLGGLGVLVVWDLLALRGTAPAKKEQPSAPVAAPTPPPPQPAPPKRETHWLASVFTVVVAVGLPTAYLTEKLPFSPWISVPLSILLSLMGYLLLVMGSLLIRFRKHPQVLQLAIQAPIGLFIWFRLLPLRSLKHDSRKASSAGKTQMETRPLHKGSVIQAKTTQLAPLELDKTLQDTLTFFQNWTQRSDLHYPTGLRVFYFQKQQHAHQYLKPYGRWYALPFLGLYTSVHVPRIVMAEEWNHLGADTREHVLCHEAVHALHLPACPQSLAPHWIMEGLSQYLATRIRPSNRQPSPYLHVAAAQDLLLPAAGVLIRPRPLLRSQKGPVIFKKTLFYLQAEAVFAWLAQEKPEALRSVIFRSTLDEQEFTQIFACSPEEAMDAALAATLKTTRAQQPTTGKDIFDKVRSVLTSDSSKLEQEMALGFLLRCAPGDSLTLLRSNELRLHRSLLPEQDSLQQVLTHCQAYFESKPSEA